MQPPSDNWKRIRRAALERAQRTAIEPLEALFTAHVAVCVYYLVGSLHFQFLDYSQAFSWIEAVQLLTVAVAGVLVPILTGAVLTLHFASQRLQQLTDE